MELCLQSDLMEKLAILTDAAKYDVACTSSGVDRRGRGHGIGNSVAAGICHSFSGDGRCISLLKILMTNHCVYNCSYCQNNCNNDLPRATFTPEEICTLVIQFYRRNYIEGLFLSSGIIDNPTRTMELLFQTLYLLRTRYEFNGYIHVKAIPGADRISRGPHEHQSGAPDRRRAAHARPLQKPSDDPAPDASDPERNPSVTVAGIS